MPECHNSLLGVIDKVVQRVTNYIPGAGIHVSNARSAAGGRVHPQECLLFSLFEKMSCGTEPDKE